MTVLPKGTSSTKIQIENFAIRAEETIEAQRNLYIQEAGEEIRRKEDAHRRLVKFLREPIAESLYGSLHLKNQLSQQKNHPVGRSTEARLSTSTQSGSHAEAS